MPAARPDSYVIASGADLYAGIAAPSPPPPPPPPPPPAQSITLTALAGLSATAGGASLGFSAQVTNPTGLPLSFVTEAASGPAPTGGSSTWGTGDLNKAISLAWAAAGTSVIRVRDANNALSNSLSVTVAAAPTPPPPPPPPAPGGSALSYSARVALPGTIAHQPFTSAAEVTNFLLARDPDINMVVPYQVADAEVGGAMAIQILGAQVAVDFLAAGGNGPRTLVLDNEVLAWPTTYPFKFALGKIPNVAGTKRLFTCSARSGNNLTVTYVPTNQGEFGNAEATLSVDFPVGSAAGGEAQNWNRTFSALTAADNGKSSADPAALGTLPIRSKITGNPNLVPFASGIFGYGFCSHPDYVSSRFSPWTPNFQGLGLGDSVTRSNLIDTSEIWVQFLGWIDPTVATPNLQGGKLFGVDADITCPQQIVAGVGPDTVFTIPSTTSVPFALSKFNPNPAGPGSAGLTMTTPYSSSNGPVQPGSYEPITGKSWAATSNMSSSGRPSTGQDTPDGSSAYEYRYGQWNTYLIHLIPGKAWHYAVQTVGAWNSSTTSTVTLIDIPDDWPTSNFDIIGYQEGGVNAYSGVLNVATRSGAVLSGITQVSGSPFNASTGSILLNPASTAQAGALNGTYEVFVAHPGDAGYTTLVSLTNYPMIYGSNGQYQNHFHQSIPGYCSITFWGYRNLALGGSNVPIKNYANKFSQLIISQNWIPPAGPEIQLTGTAWTPNRGGAGEVVLSDFSQLPANTWVTVAGTDNQITDIREATVYPKSNGADGFSGVTDAWSGAAWNSARLELYHTGGGHGDSSAAENGIYCVSATTMKASRVMNRAALATALNWNGSALVSGEGFPSGANYPLSTGYPGSMHTYYGLVWIPPATMTTLGLSAPTRGGLFYPGNARSVINLDTGATTKLWWNRSAPDQSYVTSILDGTTIIQPRADFSWQRWSMTGTETTDWAATSYDPAPGTPSFGLQQSTRTSSTQFVYNSRTFCDMQERRECVSFAFTTTRVRYGAAMDAGASDWTSYSDTITLAGAGASDFVSGNFLDSGTNMLNGAGARYDAAAGCIWVMGNRAGDHLYKITGISTNTWTVTKVSGTGALTACGQGTFGKFAVFDRGGAKVAIRVSSTANAIEAMRIVA